MFSSHVLQCGGLPGRVSPLHSLSLCGPWFFRSDARSKGLLMHDLDEVCPYPHDNDLITYSLFFVNRPLHASKVS